MTKPIMRKVYLLFYFLNIYTLPDIQDQNFIFAQIIAYHSEQVAQTVKPTLHYAYFVLCLVRKRKGICTGNSHTSIFAHMMITF